MAKGWFKGFIKVSCVCAIAMLFFAVTGCVSVGVSASKSFGGSRGFDTGVGIGVHKNLDGKKKKAKDKVQDEQIDDEHENEVNQNDKSSQNSTVSQ